MAPPEGFWLGVNIAGMQWTLLVCREVITLAHEARFTADTFAPSRRTSPTWDTKATSSCSCRRDHILATVATLSTPSIGTFSGHETAQLTRPTEKLSIHLFLPLRVTPRR